MAAYTTSRRSLGPDRQATNQSDGLLIAAGHRVEHMRRNGILTIAMLCVMSVMVLATTTSQLRDVDDTDQRSRAALQLHVRPAYQVLDQPASADDRATALDDESLGSQETGASAQREPTQGDQAQTKGEPDERGLVGSAATPLRATAKHSTEEATRGELYSTTPTMTTEAPELPRVPYTEPPNQPTSTEPPAASAAYSTLAMAADPKNAMPQEEANPTVPPDEPFTTATATTTTTTTAETITQPPPATNATVTNHTLHVEQPAFDASVSRDRGVIIALHNGIVALGVSLIKDLRCLGNNELIQVYHCFPDELSAESRALLLRNETRLEIVDVCTLLVNEKKLTLAIARKFQNWWVKPLALLHTDLRDVIVLDADVIPMRDPAVLRTLPGYVRTGTTFFYDRAIPSTLYFNANARGARNKQLLRWWIETFDYAAFNLTGPAPSTRLLDSLAYNRQTCHEMDSSMVAVDKIRAGKALDVLWLLLTKTRFKLDFSWGDKEAFWLAFEFAHVDYFFSPWGVSVVSSSPNQDMEEHPDTLCGSLAHYLPVENETPELLYVNGKALIDPYPLGVKGGRGGNANQLFNVRPTHVTPRHVRKPRETTSLRKYFDECLVALGSTPLPDKFHWHLLRRRTFYMGLLTGVYSPLDKCAMF